MNTIKEQSLELFAERLATQHYPGYPTERYFLSENQYSDEAITLPPGPWDTHPEQVPTTQERESLAAQDIPQDSLGRPLHPWAKEILTNRRIGGLAGKGFYWNWGPNKTSDPVVLRHDLDEPHVLLIERGDTGNLALPGGFFDKTEDTDFIDTALREAKEEALIYDFTALKSLARIACTTPVADIRSTVHAWPETTVVRLDLPNDIATTFTEMVWKGGDDATRAYWLPVSAGKTALFGSHNVLLREALEA